MTDTELFHAEGLPVLQNRTFGTREEALASATGDVVLVRDPRTGLIHNRAFDSSLLVYDASYQNEQACSAAFREHLAAVQQIISRHMGGRPLIEIGCGKGYFLDQLTSAGFEITGIDPAYEGPNPRVVKGRFERGFGLRADGVLLRHVLEHIPNPGLFLADIAAANGGTGIIYIEVPCFDWICSHRAWFDVFYEHVNYFRLSNFHRMFDEVIDSGRLFGGQYLYVVAELSSLKVSMAGPDDTAALPSDFLAGVERAACRIRENPGRRHAVWGAGSKGVIFTIYMQRAGLLVDDVIDVNPVKQGRHLPISGLRVSAPTDACGRMRAGDEILVMNSNYLEEIRSASGDRYSYVPVDHD